MEVMKANIAYKFELMPTREQTRIFAQAAGCRRFVWNKATELQKQRLEHNLRERQKFCVHGIIGARQTGASNEHEHQTQFS